MCPRKRISLTACRYVCICRMQSGNGIYGIQMITHHGSMTLCQNNTYTRKGIFLQPSSIDMYIFHLNKKHLIWCREFSPHDFTWLFPFLHLRWRKHIWFMQFCMRVTCRIVLKVKWHQTYNIWSCYACTFLKKSDVFNFLVSHCNSALRPDITFTNSLWSTR